MSVVEIHPDELLDKEARGELTDAESARLEEHLAACSVCRFERQTRSDFRIEFETVARRQKAAAPTHVDEAPAPRSHRDAARARKWRLRAGLLLAAALLFASAAAADWSGILRGASETPGAPNAPSPVGEIAPPPSSTHGSMPSHSVATVVPPMESAAAEPSAEPASPEPAPSATATVARPTPPSPTSAPPVSTTAPVATTAPTTTTIAAPDPAPSAEPAASPAAIFAQAGDARRRGAYDDAIRAYRDLAQRYPGTAEAMTAHAILGRLLLDRGNAAGALAELDQYLRSGSTALREEALAGRALALQRLGLPRDEAAAWRALLEAYPGTGHAARARARLDALEAR